MKKLLFSANNLDLGGIETALVTLTNYLLERDYDVTIALEKKEGVFLDKISPNIKIIEYCPCNSKNILIRKIANIIKRIKFTIKYKNKFDFSACFATYSLPAGFMARIASKNTAIWGHADYLTLYNNNNKEMRKFFTERKINKYNHIVFVSEEGRESFIKEFPNLSKKVIVCNNVINDKKILNMANEKITDIKKDDDLITFVNIGRHDEKQKKLSRIINATQKLKKEKKKFRILFIGDGKDTEKYKKMVKEQEIGDKIFFLGRKQNPYPYYKIADCVILSSDYEGYPVVYLESFILNKPIITTKVSDYKQIEGRGIVVNKNQDDIYKAMKEFIEKGYTITNKFDAKEYNDKIIRKLEDIF